MDATGGLPCVRKDAVKLLHNDGASAELCAQVSWIGVSQGVGSRPTAENVEPVVKRVESALVT